MIETSERPSLIDQVLAVKLTYKDDPAGEPSVTLTSVAEICRYTLEVEADRDRYKRAFENCVEWSERPEVSGTLEASVFHIEEDDFYSGVWFERDKIHTELEENKRRVT